MNVPNKDRLQSYLDKAGSWSEDRAAAGVRQERRLILIAVTLGAIALLEAIALVFLTPLKTVVPYTLLVDRQTGYVQALKPLERDTITPDAALIRSFLVQYVIAREGFDIDSFRDSYRKVALWSAGEVRETYLTSMQSGNPASPLTALPRRSLLAVQVRSLSPIGPNSYLVRFTTVRVDPGGQPQVPQPWASVIRYRFSGAAMSSADRLINPLGFQVVHYHRDPETLLQSEPTSPVGTALPTGAVNGQVRPGLDNSRSFRVGR